MSRLDADSTVHHGPSEARVAPRGNADLALAVLVAVVAALVARTLPGNDPVRLAFAAAMLLFVPGYLFLAATLPPARRWRRRGFLLLAAAGTSPPLVGLLALATALLPHGFRVGSIVAYVTVACVVMAVIAAVRRRLVVAAGAPRRALPTHRPGDAGALDHDRPHLPPSMQTRSDPSETLGGTTGRIETKTL